MCYSDCYSALHTWRGSVANLKKNLEMLSLLEGFFGENSGFSLQNIDLASLLVMLLLLLCLKTLHTLRGNSFL